MEQMDDLGGNTHYFREPRSSWWQRHPRLALAMSWWPTHSLVNLAHLGGGQIGEVCHTADGSFEIRR